MESLELVAGDWVSISVEMEQWNLLVCQLTDLLALSCFISTLPRGEQVQAAHERNEQLAESLGFSVLGRISTNSVSLIQPNNNIQLK